MVGGACSMVHRVYTADLVALSHGPLDEIYFTDIIIHEPGRSHRWRCLLTRDPPPNLHDALHSRPLLEECKRGVNGEHGSWYGITV